MARKIIVTAALTGSFQGKETNPAIPEQPDEIAQSAYECYNAGASIVHLHARDKDGKATCNHKIFSEINTKVRAKCPIIIQDSVVAAPRPGVSVEDGIEVLQAEVLPEMMSLDCTVELVNYKGVVMHYDFSREWIIRTAQRMQALNIKPELELFSPTTIDDIFEFVEPTGCLNKPLSMSLVMGQHKISQGAMRYDFENFITCYRRIPKDCFFTSICIGKNQMDGTLLSIALGGNVRTGLEDNVWYRKGELAKSNAQLVERVVRIIHDSGNEVATPDEAREMLGIPPLSVSGR